MPCANAAIANPASPADSVRALLQRPDLADTARVNLGLQLVRALDDENAPPAERKTLLLNNLRLAKRIGFVGGELEIYNNLGALANQTSNVPEAQQYYNLAVRRSRQTGERRYLAETLQGLAGAALEQQDLPRAARLFEESVAAAEPLTSYYRGQTLEIALAGLMTVYVQLNRMPEARRIFRRLLTQSRRRHDRLAEFLTLARWGNGLRERAPDSAATYLVQADSVAATLAVPYYQAYAAMSLMETRQRLQQWPQTLALARRAAALARQSRTPDYEAEALNGMADALRHLGQPAAAFDTLQKAHVLYDSIWSQQKRDELARQQVAFGVEAQAAKLQNLEQQRRLTALRADQTAARNRWLSGALAALAVLLTVGGAFYFRLRRTSAALAQSEAQARTAENQAVAANATKDQLMSIIGHDLRGPVASFQQLTPVLQELVPAGPHAADAHRLLASLAAGARHLGELLDNLLRWARTEDGQTVPHPAHLPLAEVVGGVTALLQPVALAKRLTLNVQLAPPDLYLSADPDLLTTVLRNLIGNALKFTPEGGAISVAVGLITPPDSAPRVRFAVTDTGLGIAPARLERLLLAGTSDSTWGTAGELGTGLGLPLSARFVHLMGGTLVLRSTLGHGTTAEFSLPAEAKPSPSEAPNR